MTHDDPFTAHLRTLAAQAPRVPVDHARVLRAGRRRRAVRATRVGAVVVAAVVGVYAGAGALPGTGGGTVAPAAPAATGLTAAPSTAPTSTPTAEPPRAVVDATAGTITLPLDEWLWSAADLATTETAVELYVSRCMADAGLGDEFVFHGPFPVQPEHVGYGVWVRDVVLESGYASLEMDDSYPGSGVDAGDPGMDVQRGCYLGALDEGFMYDTADFEVSAPLGHQPPAYLPAGQVVLEEWRQCLAEGGVEPPSDDTSVIPTGVLGAPLDEQVRIGLIDVDCKERTELVQRLADIDAAEQVAYIERGREHLVQLRAVQQAALAKSRAYLQDAGVPIPGE